MASLNKIMLIGNIGKDPELRFTNANTPVVTLSVATSETWKDANGQKKESTEWHKVVVYGKTAEACAKFLKTGSQVYVEGKIQTRSWDDAATGTKKYITEVKADKVQFMNSKRSGDGGGSEAETMEMPDDESGFPSDIPF